MVAARLGRRLPSVAQDMEQAVTYIEVEYKGKKYRAYPKSSMVYYPVARLTSQNFWRLMEAHGPIYHEVLKLAKERQQIDGYLHAENG